MVYSPPEPSSRDPADGTLPERMQPTKSTKPGHIRPQQIVFLQGDTVEPDTVSQQLLKSGDIEVNPGPAHCGACNREFTLRNITARCGGCMKQFCKSSCTGLTRWKIDKALREGTSWRCKECLGEQPEKRNKKHPTTEGIIPGKCTADGCKRNIRATDDFLICSTCQKHWHKKRGCSEMTIKQVLNLGDRSTWGCPRCQSIEAENLHNPPSQGDSTNFRFKNTQNTKLKILQLNIDSVLSKTEELKLFLKKHKIDIFFLQEPKLTESDRTRSFRDTHRSGKTDSNPKASRKTVEGAFTSASETRSHTK